MTVFAKPRNERDYDEIARDAATKALLDAVRPTELPTHAPFEPTHAPGHQL